jgi:4-hydroxythreonine-4-phosphate dehydrogenase
MIRTPENENRIVVGITHGDINSISYEIIIKTLFDQRVLELFTPVVYGSSKVASYHRKMLNIPDFSFNIVKNASQANTKRPNMVNVTELEVKIDLGHSTQTAGELALLSLEAAVQELMKGALDVLVTAPINKENIQQPGFNFPGHTEYLADRMGAKEYLMLMVSDHIRVGMVTGHIPVHDVAVKLSSEIIYSKLKVFNASLQRDFGIRKPRIAVLGLNPHAGDHGVIGDEEATVISPAIARANSEGMIVVGPFPADGFFMTETYSKFDGILAMYHDQGMIPFKMLSFERGVNYTAGLPFVRTSPAHGTAYDIAGKDIASPDSFRSAIYLACDILNNRQLFDELNSNPLAIGQYEKEN